MRGGGEDVGGGGEDVVGLAIRCLPLNMTQASLSLLPPHELIPIADTAELFKGSTLGQAFIPIVTMGRIQI